MCSFFHCEISKVSVVFVVLSVFLFSCLSFHFFTFRVFFFFFIFPLSVYLLLRAGSKKKIDFSPVMSKIKQVCCPFFFPCSVCHAPPLFIVSSFSMCSRENISFIFPCFHLFSCFPFVSFFHFFLFLFLIFMYCPLLFFLYQKSLYFYVSFSCFLHLPCCPA